MKLDVEEPEVLIKLDSNSGVVNSGRSRLMEVVSAERTNSSGAEGSKTRFQMVTFDSLEPSLEVEDLFAKEFRSERDALKVIEKFEILRERGYNIPPEVYYMYRNGKHYVVMTDLSEGGKLPVWGSNRLPTTEEFAELKKMLPTEPELEAAILPVAQKFDDENCLAGRDVWLIRRTDSGELQAFVVDITFLELKRPAGFRKDISQQRASFFIEEVLSDLKFLNKE